MTTTVTPETLKRRARCAFDTIDDEDVQTAIDEATRNTSAYQWGARYNDGVFYLACHYLTELDLILQAVVDGGTAADSAGAIAPGPIQSEAILAWKVSYAVSEGGIFDDALATTAWGRMYIQRRSLIISDRCI